MLPYFVIPSAWLKALKKLISSMFLTIGDDHGKRLGMSCREDSSEPSYPLQYGPKRFKFAF